MSPNGDAPQSEVNQSKKRLTLKEWRDKSYSMDALSDEERSQIVALRKEAADVVASYAAGLSSVVRTAVNASIAIKPIIESWAKAIQESKILQIPPEIFKKFAEAIEKLPEKTRAQSIGLAGHGWFILADDV